MPKNSSFPSKTLFSTPFSKAYWVQAASEFRNLKMLLFAALVVALRVALKSVSIPIAADLRIGVGFFGNAFGAMIYGPVVGLCVGAVSDTLGYLIFPSGIYFFPFIFVEMLSSFIFGLFFWKRQITVSRVLAAKFTVNLICNIILTSLFTKWMYTYFSDPKAATYNIINLVRIVKNLVMFPVESVLIVLILGAFITPLKNMKLIAAGQEDLVFRKKHIVFLILTAVVSVGLVLFYIFYLKDYVSAHNIKLF